MLSSLDRQFSQRKMSISKEKFSWTEAYNPENHLLSRQLYASHFLFQSNMKGRLVVSYRLYFPWYAPIMLFT